MSTTHQDNGEGSPRAIIHAVPVTDALKVVSDGLVVSGIDREKVIEVIGYELSNDVAEVVGEVAPGEIFEKVETLGFKWEVRMGSLDPH